jgi:hypothetical protein
MKLLKKVIIGCALFLLCASALFYWYHKLFPYGDRTCCLPCMMSALRLYAADHGDWYPKGGRTSLESLQLLYSETNDYTGEVGLLAGISGNLKETERRIKAGLQIDEFQVGLTFPVFAMMTMTKWQLFGNDKEGFVLMVVLLMDTLLVLQMVITNKFLKNIGMNFSNSKKLCDKRHSQNEKLNSYKVFLVSSCLRG